VVNRHLVCKKRKQAASSPQPLSKALVIMNNYEYIRKGIKEAGFSPVLIENLCADISTAKTLEIAMGLYGQFEDEANKLPWPQDSDFGALVLQAEHANANREIGMFMLYKAIERAVWCATCATSGGEGLARAKDIKELKIELSKYN
jgi:hypothetical protein